MNKIVMYCTDTCPYCQRAEALLGKKGVTPEKIRVDGNANIWAEMQHKTGRDTVPQIFIGTRHVGGFDDLVELDMDGELDPLLGRD